MTGQAQPYREEGGSRFPFDRRMGEAYGKRKVHPFKAFEVRDRMCTACARRIRQEVSWPYSHYERDFDRNFLSLSEFNSANFLLTDPDIRA